MKSIARIAVAVVAFGAAVALAGCGSNESSTDHSSAHGTASETVTTHNDADVHFLEMMYPHHAQAVQMAQLVPSRTENPDVTSLATAIEGAQQPEMDRMTALLNQFGEPAPSADMGHAGHGAMSGMMSPEQMQSLKDISGPAFDKAWLELMIAHHNGAIEMAQAELTDGSSADVKAMADSIAKAQRVEVQRMQQLLGQK